MSRIGTGAGPFLVSTTIETTEDGGSEWVETWQGSEAECRNKAIVLRALGATRLRTTSGPGGDWQAQGSFPFSDDEAEQPVDTMELDTNVVSRAVYQSPIYRKRFSDYNTTTHHSPRANATLAVIRDCVNKYLREWGEDELVFKVSIHGLPAPPGNKWNNKEEAIVAEFNFRLTVIAMPLFNPAGMLMGFVSLTNAEKRAASQLFNAVAFRGTTSFLEYETVFRRTVTAGSPNAVRANFEGVGKIWTTPEVNSWEGIPADGWFTLPPDSQWLKDKPSVLKAYGQKTQLTYHYTEIKTASALLYEARATAVLIDLP